MEDARAPTLHGIRLIREGRLREAVSLLRPHEDPYAALHLGHAQRFLGAYGEADRQLRSALAAGERLRVRPLVVAALCGLGETALALEDRRAALAHFGRALGLTELGGVSATQPLAGLAQAQGLWGNRTKARALAERALARAAADDLVGEARACLALGLVTEAAAATEILERGRRAAQGAPHRPLELQLWAEILERDPNPGELEAAYGLALELDMAPEAARLAKLRGRRQLPST